MMKKLIVAAVAALSCAGAASAQSYPTRPITMVVPFAAGGPQDTIARVVGARMSEILGQQIVIENVGGAGGTTGSLRLKNAAPDGYTILIGTTSTHALAALAGLCGSEAEFSREARDLFGVEVE